MQCIIILMTVKYKNGQNKNEVADIPKIVTEEERTQVRDAIYAAAISLIRQKGVRKVTVDDIAAAVGISKGAFYAYYPSREVCVYEALRRSEGELFARMEVIMAQGLRDRERTGRFLREVFLAPDSVLLHLSPTDLEVLLRKLPSEYREREKNKSDDYFRRSLALLGVGENQMETVALLTDCLGVVATDKKFSENGRQQALDVLVEAISNYLSEEDAL